jgi:hypothetical protein
MALHSIRIFYLSTSFEPQQTNTWDQELTIAKQNDQKSKKNMKKYGDLNLKTKKSNFKIGDLIQIKQQKTSKIKTTFDPNPYTIFEMKGSMIIAKRGEEVIARNSSHCKLFKRLQTSQNNSKYSNIPK